MYHQDDKSYVVPYPDPDRPFHVILVPVPFEIWKELTRDNDRIRKKPNITANAVAQDHKFVFAPGIVQAVSIN